MPEFGFYINVILFAVGLALIYVLLTQQDQHPWVVRAVMLIYFFVVIQYNVDHLRLLANKLLLSSAAVALTLYIRQPIASAE